MGLIGAVLAIIVWDLLVKNNRPKVLGVTAIALLALFWSGGSSISYLVSGVEPQLLFGGLEAGGPGLTVFDDFTHMFRVLFAFVSSVSFP